MSRVVSVVVPTRDAGRTLRACLASVRDQTYPWVELLVIDNGSRDDTPAIIAEFADVVLRAGPERSAQRNIGWRTATGDTVVFIDADMILDPAVIAESVQTLDAHEAVDALVIPELAVGEGFFARCRGLEKRLYLADPAVEAARVYRRSALARTGGFDEALTAFEDWDLADRVARTGGGGGRITATIRHDEGRISLRRSFLKKRYYGRWLADYRGSGMTPRSFARWQLLRHWRVLCREPQYAAGLLVLKSIEMLGLLAGAAQHRSRHR